MESDKNATVHGIVIDVSPIRMSKRNSDVKYFSGRLPNGNKEARIICFKPELRSLCEKSRQEINSVAVVNCNNYTPRKI